MEKKINNILFITKSDGTKLTFKVLLFVKITIPGLEPLGFFTN